MGAIVSWVSVEDTARGGNLKINDNKKKSVLPGRTDKSMFNVARQFVSRRAEQVEPSILKFGLVGKFGESADVERLA